MLARAQERDRLDPERLRTNLKRIDRSAARLGVLVNDLLDVSRLQFGQLRLEQVVGNLIDNALKYSAEGTPVQVRIGHSDGRVLLCVADEGIGLPHGAAEQIFDPFGRAPNAAARQIQGLGLGLYISRQIVEQHGGRIWADSPGEGRGTTVYVSLPPLHGSPRGDRP